MTAEPAQAPPPSGARNLHLVNVVPGRHAFGAVKNVAMQIWFDHATIEGARFLKGSGEQMVARYPDGFSSIHILKARTGLPSAGVREELAQRLRELQPHYHEALLVMEGTGFWVSAMHGLIAGLRMATRVKGGFRMFATKEDLLAWLPAQHRARTGVAVTTQEVAEALQYLEAAGGACR